MKQNPDHFFYAALISKLSLFFPSWRCLTYVQAEKHVQMLFDVWSVHLKCHGVVEEVGKYLNYSSVSWSSWFVLACSGLITGGRTMHSLFCLAGPWSTCLWPGYPPQKQKESGWSFCLLSCARISRWCLSKGSSSVKEGGLPDKGTVSCYVEKIWDFWGMIWPE